MSFGHFQTIITSSGWFSGSYWYGSKALGEIFPRQQSLRIFDVVWGRYTFRKLGYWSKESPNPDLSKGKLVFWPIYSLICFKGLLGVKISVKLVLEINSRLRLGEERREDGKGRNIKVLPRPPRNFKWNSLGVIPIKVYEIFYVGLIRLHTNLVSI